MTTARRSSARRTPAENAIADLGSEVLRSEWHTTMNFEPEEDEADEDGVTHNMVVCRPDYDSDDDGPELYVKIDILELPPSGVGPCRHITQTWDVIELERFCMATLAAMRADGVLQRAKMARDEAIEEEEEEEEEDEDEEEDEEEDEGEEEEEEEDEGEEEEEEEDEDEGEDEEDDEDPEEED